MVILRAPFLADKLAGPTRCREPRNVRPKEWSMRQALPSFLVAAVLCGATACAPSETPTSLFAPHTSLKQGGVPDTHALPDLTVDSKSTQNNWIVRVEDLPADFCSVIEGEVT